MDMLDTNDPLIQLANIFPWSNFDEEFKKYYTGEGRPPKPINPSSTIIKAIQAP